MVDRGLRERRKLLTRQELSDAATRLFLEHGFEGVTIAQVAEAAGVAKMTVTNHFPRKEDLVLDAHREFAGGPARAVEERKAGESPIAAIRRDHLAAMDRLDPLLGFADADFARLVTGSPTLLARLREIHQDRELALRRALVPVMGDFPAAIAAAEITAAFRVLLTEVLGRIARDEKPSAIAKTVRPLAVDAFDGLARALRDRRSR